MYGYNIDRGINTAFDRVGKSVGGVTGPVTGTIGQQIEQRPWLLLGAALVAGYVLGSMGGDSDADNRDQLWRNEERERAYRGIDHSRTTTTHFSAMGDHTTHTAPSSSGAYGTPNYNTPSSSGAYGTPSYNTSSSSGAYGTPNYNTPSSSGAYSTPAVAAQMGHHAEHAPHQPQPPRSQQSQPNAISSTISRQVDKLTATAVPTIRNLLRDAIRDNVPALRDQVDALDRRDGRTPPAPAPRTTPPQAAPATTLRDVDTGSTRGSK